MEDRSWMYQRKTTFGHGMNPEFVAGVYKFLEFATSHCNPQDGGEIRCPCSSCKNRRFYHKDIIISHLYRKGFVPGYTNWSCHGEPSILLFPPTQTDNACGRTYENSYHEMVMDGASSSSNVEHSTNVEDSTLEVNDSRVLLEPYGDTFTLQSKAAATITNIFHERFCGAYISFKKVPPHVKELWWTEFSNKYRWNPMHEAAIKKAWENRCRDRMKDMLCRIRRSNRKPVWMSEIVYQELRAEWGKEEYVKKCQKMSLNRTTCNDGQGIGKHTGGSISFPEHELRMKQQKGESYEYHELWDSLHTVHKEILIKGQFIDERAKKTCSQISSSSSNNVDEKTLFVEATGGMKKGHIYEFGSGSKRLKVVASISSTSQSSQLESTTIENLKKEVSDLKQQLKDVIRGQEEILKLLKK